MRKKKAQPSSVMFLDQNSRILSERRKLPPLRERFRVEVAPGADDPEAMSDRSRALVVWALERWREDRKAGLTSEGLLQSREQLFRASREELN